MHPARTILNIFWLIGNQTKKIENQNYRAVTFLQSQLDPINLFIPVSVSDYALLKVWENTERSPKLKTTKEEGLTLDEGLRSRQEGYPECGLSASDNIGLGSNDFWIIEKLDDDIPIKHRVEEISRIKFHVPIKSTFLGLRNIDNRTSFDVSEVEDRIMLEPFQEFTELAMYCNLNEDNLSLKWKDWVLKRGAHLAVIETLHIEAANTFLFAYYSEPLRAFSSKFWNVKTKSLDQAKIMTLCFNSSLNFIQLMKHRIPTGWFKIRGYVFENLKALSLEKISINKKRAALELFGELRETQFPAIWKQLARNIPKNYLTVSDLTLMRRVFGDFDNELGKGFEARKSIDLMFMKILDIKSKESSSEFLIQMYAKSLKEICLIKQSATEV